MSLSKSTVLSLADVLKKDIINHIYEDERYFEVMTDLVSDALRAKLGECNEDLIFDIGMIIMDRIELK
jgi:hypothetical protein